MGPPACMLLMRCGMCLVCPEDCLLSMVLCGQECGGCGASVRPTRRPREAAAAPVVAWGAMYAWRLLLVAVTPRWGGDVREATCGLQGGDVEIVFGARSSGCRMVPPRRQWGG